MSPSNPPPASGATGDATGSERPALPDPLDRLWRHPSELHEPQHTRRSNGARPHWGALIGLGFASALIGSALTVGILGLSGLLSGNPSPTVKDQLIKSSVDSARANAAKVVRKSIVAISSTDAAGSRQGAGICVRHDGIIVTSTALIGDATTVTVEDFAGEQLTGTVVARDPVSGLAVVRIESDMAAASIAKASPLAGDSVIVLGTGTLIGEGIVNSVDALATDPSGLALVNALITSARPTSAPAGSVLVDRSGKIGGIFLPGSLGAVPIEYVREVLKVVDDSPASETVTTLNHAWAGVRFADSIAGPKVQTVANGGPAYNAGLRLNDVITSIDGVRTASAERARAAVVSRWPGELLRFVVMRDGSKVEFTVQTMIDPAVVSINPPPSTTTAP